MHGSFEDPATFVGSNEDKLKKYREVRDRIDNRIQDWLNDHGNNET